MRAYISLGSNMGDGPVHLAEARAAVPIFSGKRVRTNTRRNRCMNSERESDITYPYNRRRRERSEL